MHTFLLDFTVKSSSNTEICTASPAKVDFVVGPGQTHKRREKKKQTRLSSPYPLRALKDKMGRRFPRSHKCFLFFFFFTLV